MLKYLNYIKTTPNVECILVESYFQTSDGVIEFFEETGLKDVFQNKKIKNLVDYVFGVEVGLDTHARKNRGGKYMERAVANLFDDHGVEYKEQVTTTSIEGIEWVGGDVKQFDFVIETENCTYLIETNYYSSGGSKLNETARSYTNVSSIIEGHDGFEFVWITDGLGWHTARNKLEDSYTKIDKLYNLKTVVGFIEDLRQEV
jgi:type II restriction enzyme